MSRRKRKGLSKGLRFDVLKRDSFACTYCGARPPNTELHVDHIKPVAEGGSNDPSNLVTACVECNLGKSDRRMVVSRQEHEERLERVVDDALVGAEYFVYCRFLRSSNDPTVKDAVRDTKTLIREAYDRGVPVSRILHVAADYGSRWQEWRRDIKAQR